MKMPWEEDKDWNNTATTIVKGEPMKNKEWQIGKPKGRGKYLVTMEYWVGDKERYVDMAYYGIMYGEKHECFYQVDSEWGDCKLDGVLAWMPLPEPWKGE